jgi:sugar phosphate permease
MTPLTAQRGRLKQGRLSCQPRNSMRLLPARHRRKSVRWNSDTGNPPRSALPPTPQGFTPTHWHIAAANGLGWGFNGMDGVIFAIVSPFVIKEFAVDLGTYRSGVQIAMFIGIAGLYFWPWLADKFGRRNLLAINIAMFSLCMPLVALSSSFWMFVGLYALVRFSLNGEWAIGSMLVAETWPARMRGFVVSADRSTWGIGAALAGGISAYIVEQYGWRAAFIPPGNHRPDRDLRAHEMP